MRKIKINSEKISVENVVVIEYGSVNKRGNSGDGKVIGIKSGDALFRGA